jgi:hypothetical protein
MVLSVTVCLFETNIILCIPWIFDIASLLKCHIESNLYTSVVLRYHKMNFRATPVFPDIPLFVHGLIFCKPTNYCCAVLAYNLLKFKWEIVKNKLCQKYLTSVTSKL